MERTQQFRPKKYRGTPLGQWHFNGTREPRPDPQLEVRLKKYFPTEILEATEVVKLIKQAQKWPIFIQFWCATIWFKVICASVRRRNLQSIVEMYPRGVEPHEVALFVHYINIIIIIFGVHLTTSTVLGHTAQVLTRQLACQFCRLIKTGRVLLFPIKLKCLLAPFRVNIRPYKGYCDTEVNLGEN